MAGKSYSFRVAAVNAVGVGQYSEASTTITQQAVPGAPTALTVADRGKDWLQMEWQAPMHDGGSPVLGYNVTFSGSASNRTFKNIPDTHFHIPSLAPGAHFETL